MAVMSAIRMAINSAFLTLANAQGVRFQWRGSYQPPVFARLAGVVRLVAKMHLLWIEIAQSHNGGTICDS